MVALHPMNVRYGCGIGQTGDCRPQGVYAVDYMSSCPLRAHVVYAVPNVLEYDRLRTEEVLNISAPVAPGSHN